MQHPVGYEIVNGEAQLTSVWASAHESLGVLAHTILAGLTAGAAVVRRAAGTSPGPQPGAFPPAAKLALIVLVPVAGFNLWFGSHFGILVTEPSR